MSLKSQLDKRAEQLLEATSAAEPPVALDIQIDAFKAVSAYYLGTQRGAKGKGDEEEGVTFADLINGSSSITTEGNA